MVRKCVLFSILLAAVFLFCGTGPAFGQGSGDILFNEFVKNESTYLAQKIKFPRSSFHKPFTLGEQLSDIFGEILTLSPSGVPVECTTNKIFSPFFKYV